MQDLLHGMKEGATRVVSHIVETTNSATAVTLPAVNGASAAAGNVEQQLLDPQFMTRKRPHRIEEEKSDDTINDCPVITPDVGATEAPTHHPSDLDLAEHTGDDVEDVSALSADKCGEIVDCLFDEIDVRVLSPPGKRARFASCNDSTAAVSDLLPLML